MRSSPPPKSTACLRSHYIRSDVWRRVRVWISRLKRRDGRWRHPIETTADTDLCGSRERSDDVYKCGALRFFHSTRRPMTPRRSRPARERRLCTSTGWKWGAGFRAASTRFALAGGDAPAAEITSLGTDNEIPARLSETLAERLNAIVAPTIPCSCDPRTWAPSPAGRTSRAEAFTDYVAAVWRRCRTGTSEHHRDGGHGGNTDALKGPFAPPVHEETGVYLAVFSGGRVLWQESLGVRGLADRTRPAAMLAIASEQVSRTAGTPRSRSSIAIHYVAYPTPGSLIFYGDAGRPVTPPEARASVLGARRGRVGDVLET